MELRSKNGLMRKMNIIIQPCIRSKPTGGSKTIGIYVKPDEKISVSEVMNMIKRCLRR